eukprot:tig00020830_g14386.t1
MRPSPVTPVTSRSGARFESKIVKRFLGAAVRPAVRPSAARPVLRRLHERHAPRPPWTVEGVRAVLGSVLALVPASAPSLAFGCLAAAAAFAARRVFKQSGQESLEKQGPLAQRLLAIHQAISDLDLKKLAPVVVMYFCILLAFTMIRDIKDVLVVTAPFSGAEAIPFLRTWIVVPMAFLSMIVYNRLADYISQDKLFLYTLVPFLIWFTGFAYVLYPLRSRVHPLALAQWIHAHFPPGPATALAILASWSFVLFYLSSELWGSLILSVGFWGFMNQIFSVREAKRVYPILGIVSNIPALFFGGLIVKQLSHEGGQGEAAFSLALMKMMAVVIACGVVTMGCFYITSRQTKELRRERLIAADLAAKCLGDNCEEEERAREEEERKKKEKKKQLTFRESATFIAQSPYLRNMAILVVMYNLSVQLVETFWKHLVKTMYPDPGRFSRYMGNVEVWTAAAAVISAGSSAFLMPRLPWRFNANVTPALTLVLGAVFMFLFLFRNLIPAAAVGALGGSPLMAAGAVGTFYLAVTHAVKYSFFDVTKEMVFIPLDQESKSKGKAAIDVLGQTLGKSGGAILLQGLVVLFGSFDNASSAIAALFLATMGLCVYSVNELATDVRPLFKALAEQDAALWAKEEADKEAAERAEAAAPEAATPPAARPVASACPVCGGLGTLDGGARACPACSGGLQGAPQPQG